MDAEFRRQARRHQAIVIDCSQISTLNSTGTGRLVSWLREAAIHNVHVGMTNVTPTLRAMFDLTSLSAVLPATVAAPQATQNRAA